MAFTILFGLSLWLGSYLIARGSQNRSVLWVGIGLIVYALVIGLQLMSQLSPSSGTRSLFDNLGSYLLLIPGFFWLFALITIWPSLRSQFERRQDGRRISQRGVGLFLVGSILLGLSFGLIIMRLRWIPTSWLTFSIGADLCLLGYAIARFDAFDLGETLLPDLIRSLDGAILTVLTFSSPVVVAMQVIGVEYMALWILLLTNTAFAIMFQVFREPFESALDRTAFRAFPQLQQQRANLRAAADALPKLPMNGHPELLEGADFARLTRRALSNYGDLNRLASSPLTQLSVIETNLAAQNLEVNTLTRAAELKRLLTDAIAHLKPDSASGFDSTDEWRYYNALYFPYVAGLRPYSRRADHADLDPSYRAALDWFREQVPERTLHNWQNGAAKLVAQYLLELK